MILPFLSVSIVLCSDMASLESGGWVTILNSIGGASFPSGTTAPSVSVSPYTDTDMYACGFYGTAKSSGSDGIWQLGIKYCHKYNTGYTQTGDMIGWKSGDGPWTSFSSDCPAGYFVTYIQLKYEGHTGCGDNDGVTGLKFLCSAYPGYSSGQHSAW